MGYLVIDNINKDINNTRILKDISFGISEGEFISILGPSGCGKTTLLRIISGLEDPTSGEIYLNNNIITNLSSGKRGFGFVFQNYVLFPNMTVEKNIGYGLYNKGLNKSEANSKINYILDLIDITDIKNKYPGQLSGGQQQRVALGRALILSPKVLLLDEPLSALDAKIRESLRWEIKKIQKELRITTIMVTHDQEEALTLSDRIVVMEKCKVSQIGTPEEIYNNPKNKFVADFIGKVNILKTSNGMAKIIRPENIKYSACEKQGFIDCFIKNMEFKGAFYRLTLQMKGIKTTRILVDVMASEKEKLGLKENMDFYIELSNSLAISC
ncbi:putative 2-aminoethylphosphonate ABC transporter ATP-binding protein [Clostridium tetani]|uniref:Putative 2-aminoethylphosphonate ABC transporter ATP-binding protein n=1 Tax=Clostridium tetani TaxID=1513 RepID=A0A4Q0VBX1_CLOTA|nr:ABC transporter ATP-binding protein [Clostridium tetani]RXI47029.1 putative 2-aminoethylphosphonate ABC transporter ATP-binding protein [Clostridium tetani]